MRSGRAVFFSSRRRHTRSKRDWSSDVCSSDLEAAVALAHALEDRMSNAQRSPPPIDEAVIDIALRAVDQLRALGHDRSAARSEERRVGKEWRARWSGISSNK